jgi:shikimate kinase
LRDNGRRPLFRGSDVPTKLRQLFDERDSLYEQTSHLIVETANLPAAAAVLTIRSQLALP